MSWNKKNDVFALMCGHGTSLDGSFDSGCVYGTYTEAELCLKITKQAAKYLRKVGVRVITDADSKNNKNMTACVKWANEKKAKYYMSVHCDYSGATKGVYPLYVSAEGKKMAKTVGKFVAKAMGMTYKGAAKRTDLYELNATDMPSCIFECGAIKADLAKLKESKKYGKALAEGICKYIGVPFEITTGITLPSRGYFQFGDTGDNVKVLQRYLNEMGFDCGDVDGIYGNKTMSAVKKFQKRYGLEADGLFGSKSLKKANELKSS